MKENEKCSTGLLKGNEEIRKLILDNPDLPLVFMATEDANIGEYSTMFCASVSAKIGEVLDCQQEINDEIIYTDREDFKDDICDYVTDKAYDYEILSEKWFDTEVERIVSEYEPYWKKCILITVGN